MPPIRPMCWSTPVASVSICLQVRFIYLLSSVILPPGYITHAAAFITSWNNFTWHWLLFHRKLSPRFLHPFSGIFISTCNVDVRWFPFDIQRCELKFGSWTFDGWMLDIQMKEADVSGYMPNGEWDLLGKPGSWWSGWQTVLLSNSAYITAMQCSNPPVCTKDKLHLNICLWSESSSGSVPHDKTLKWLNDKSVAVMFCCI